VSLAEALEGAASALPELGDSIRPANGDPSRVLAVLRPADRVAVLTWLFSHKPDAGAELAHAWCDEESGVEAVFGVEETALPKAGRKALRRVVHGLRARGIAPAPPPPRKVVATLPRVEEEIEAAFLSSIDPSGARVAYLVESAAGAGARLFEMVLDEERGVIEFSAYTATRGEARRFVRTALAREGSPATEVPPDSLRALLARIAAGQLPDRAFPRAFAEWRSRVTTHPPDAQTPGELARAELGNPAPEAGKRAAELVAAGELGPWPAPVPVLRKVAEDLQEALKSRLIVSGAQRRDRSEAALQEAIALVFDPVRTERTAARLEETAYILWKRGREDDARACLAAARGLREGPAVDQPVARALLEAALGPVLEKLREEEKSSLIVKL
jgi:hypothetical protein